jgi:Tol biopolymer transport system component
MTVYQVPRGPSTAFAGPDGIAIRKITDGLADTDPAPSPDGTRLAFVRKASRNDGGGELWMLDLSADSAPASAPRRLVDPAALVPTFGGEDPAQGTLDSPRWSPTGDRIAFLKTGGHGGFRLTAAVATGAVQAPARPLYADRKYSWARDGKHIAWAGGRMDVSPVGVGVLTVGGASQPVATGTNASSYTDTIATGLTRYYWLKAPDEETFLRAVAALNTSA